MKFSPWQIDGRLFIYDIFDGQVLSAAADDHNEQLCIQYSETFDKLWFLYMGVEAFKQMFLLYREVEILN